MFRHITALIMALYLSAYCRTGSFEEYEAGSFMPQPGDSVLFRRGDTYFANITLLKNSSDSVYFGAYGDEELPRPVLDGSRSHFFFDSDEWSDCEIINGIRFYKKKLDIFEDVSAVYCGTESLTPSREPDNDEEPVREQKNSFKGFFKIDSVDVKEPRKVFFDRNNSSDWAGAELVTKTYQWSYEIRKIKNCSNGRIELDESTQDTLKKNWGYFIQKHRSALDEKNEWYYDLNERTLYFLPNSDRCMVYVCVNSEDNNAGIDIRGRSGVTAEGLHFRNAKFGVRLEEARNIIVKNCLFRSCVYGVMNRKSRLNNIRIEDCIFRDMGSYGIRLTADNVTITGNIIDSVGLSLSCESKGYNNLNGIEVYGSSPLIMKNSLANLGYCGIRIYICPGAKVIGNTIENAGLTVADCGGIYTWHAMEGNKLIKGNFIKNIKGNVDGTTGSAYNSTGIYLDELSLHFRVDSNYVTGAGNGIYLQNSRSDTVRFNHTESNVKSEFHINHGGNILNGGRLNPDNDPEFDPDRLDSIPVNYTWDREERLLYFKDKRNGVVYVEPGNNLVTRNSFIPDPSKNKFSFQFRTWRNFDSNTIPLLTGTDDFFYENMPISQVGTAGLYIQSSNVKDLYNDGKVFDLVKYDIGKANFKELGKFLKWTGTGVKIRVEK